MSEKVIIRVFVSTWKVGSKCQEDYETDYTQDEWNNLSEEEREEIINDYYDSHKSSFLDGGAWVKTDDDLEE